MIISFRYNFLRHGGAERAVKSSPTFHPSFRVFLPSVKFSFRFLCHSSHHKWVGNTQTRPDPTVNRAYVTKKVHCIAENEEFCIREINFLLKWMEQFKRSQKLHRTFLVQFTINPISYSRRAEGNIGFPPRIKPAKDEWN